jgi:hypothetical protein
MLSYLADWTLLAILYELNMEFVIGTAIFQLFFKLMKENVSLNEPDIWDKRLSALGSFGISLGFTMGCIFVFASVYDRINKIERTLERIESFQINQARQNVIIGKP